MDNGSRPFILIDTSYKESEPLPPTPPEALESNPYNLRLEYPIYPTAKERRAASTLTQRPKCHPEPSSLSDRYQKAASKAADAAQTPSVARADVEVSAVKISKQPGNPPSANTETHSKANTATQAPAPRPEPKAEAGPSKQKAPRVKRERPSIPDHIPIQESGPATRRYNPYRPGYTQPAQPQAPRPTPAPTPTPIPNQDPAPPSRGISRARSIDSMSFSLPNELPPHAVSYQPNKWLFERTSAERCAALKEEMHDGIRLPDGKLTRKGKFVYGLFWTFIFLGPVWGLLVAAASGVKRQD